MKHSAMFSGSTAANVLSIEEAGVSPFLHRCVKDRSLSTLVSDLNYSLLFGSADEKDMARKALKHLGFI